MHATRYLLLGISILSWTEVILTHDRWSGQHGHVEVNYQEGPEESSEPSPEQSSEQTPEQSSEPSHENIEVKYQQSPEQSTEPQASTATESKDLTFIVAENEVFTITLKDGTVGVSPAPSGTKGALTGGIFGDAQYLYSTFIFSMKQNSEGVEFNSTVTYYKKEYQSYDEARYHEDGLVQVLIPINANGPNDNPKYGVFQTEMAKIKKPGDSTTIHSGDSYSWFKNFPENTSYIYFRSSCFDQDTKESYDCATIQLPLEDDNFISSSQFKATFGRIAENGDIHEVDSSPTEEVETGITVFSV